MYTIFKMITSEKICSIFLISQVIFQSIHCAASSQLQPQQSSFNAGVDANTIYDAFKGFGTSEKQIEKVLKGKSCSQRLEIGQNFNKKYGPIAQFIRDDTSGSYQTLLLSLFTCKESLYAFHLNEAFSFLGIGTDKESLAEILVTFSDNPQSRDSLIEEYQKMFFTSLYNDIKAQTSGDFYNVLMELLLRSRDPPPGIINAKMAKLRAALLNNEISDWSSCRRVLDATLMEVNIKQLHLILEEFNNVVGSDIEMVIKNQFTDEKQIVYQQLVRYIKNRRDFFVDRLFESLKNGPNDLTLMRIILVESERDLVAIKQSFQQKYEISLRKLMVTTLSDGDFKELLLCFVGDDEIDN